MKRATKTTVVVIIAVAIAVSASLPFLLSRSDAQNISYDRFLLNMSAELNKKMPVMADKETRCDSTSSGPGLRMNYYLTLVNGSRSDMDVPTFESMMREQIAAGYRTDPKFKEFREHKVAIHFIYRDKNGEQICDVGVGPE
jgi:hypothetical protein